MPKVTVEAENIPDELKERDQWLMWDKSADTPRQPHWRGNFGISWSDPDDWYTFAEAVEAASERDSWGIGYVMALDNDDHPRGLYGCLDVDGALREKERDKPKDWVPSLEKFIDDGAYVEYSPSGEGLHIPIVGHEAPEWWSDSHFSDDEHEGIEYLTNKFVTFTGNVVEPSGDSVTEIDPTKFLFDSYESINGESPRLSPSESPEGGDDYDGDDPLDEDVISDALDHINPDVSYPKWRDIGFAVHDFDSGSRGKHLFESWSRGGSKWDSESERYVNAIWESANQGDGVTVGTLIHYARQEGWEIPRGSKGRNPKTRRRRNGDSDEDTEDEGSEPGMSPLSWSEVRFAYAEESKKEGRFMAAKKLRELTGWIYVVESETLWVYDDDRGYFHRWGEEHVAQVLERELDTHFSRTEREEVTSRLEASNQTHRDELNAGAKDGYYLCVGNGVVDLETGELHDHDPSYKFTRGLEWDYHPAAADPEPVKEFLDDITKRPEDRDTLLDHLAHGLMPGHPYRAFAITYGPGGNGKTQMGTLFRGFVGEENAASVELQDLTGDDSFATGGLPGAFVNVGDDISVTEIRDVSIIKSLTGGGTVRANEKYEKQYEFKNEAAMFFSANEPPRISEESDAIGDRLYPIEMPYRFLDQDEIDPDNPYHKPKIPGYAQTLLEDEAAMRGLLLLCVKHAQELIESRGQYSMPEGPKQRREIYEAASDPIRRFALDHMETASQADMILKDDAFAVYRAMCEEEDERVASEDGFKRQIAQQALIDVESSYTRQLSPGDSREACWRYVRFKEETKDLMPARLVERYFPESEPVEDGDDDGDGDSSDPESNERPAFGATPIESAAESLTGYVTVTAEVATTQRLGDDEKGTKARLKDETNVIDLVVWDGDIPGRLEELEGEYVAIQNAEVTEYEGVRQLSFVDGLTEIHEIQQGVGFTPGVTPGDGQDNLQAATDGSGELEGAQARIAEHIRTDYSAGDTVTVATIAGELSDLDPGTDVEPALESLAKEKGQLNRHVDDGYEVL